MSMTLNDDTLRMVFEVRLHTYSTAKTGKKPGTHPMLVPMQVCRHWKVRVSTSCKRAHADRRQSLSEPLLYYVLRFSIERQITALAASITNSEMDTALKVNSWTRTIILNEGEMHLPLSQTENALAVILAGARKLAVFRSLGESDLSPRILTAIAPCVHTISMQEEATWYDDITRLAVQKSDGILYHLGRFEQLRSLALRFVLDGDTNTVILLPLAVLDLPRLESFSLKLEEYDSIVSDLALLKFGTDFFAFLSQSHLPNLRRVDMDFEYEEGGFEPVPANLIDALSSFFAGHQYLDSARLSGCDALISQLLPVFGVMHLELFLSRRVPVTLGTLLHPRVARLSLKTVCAPLDFRHPMWSWLQGLPSILGAHASLRAVDIMDLHHDGTYLYFDGETVSALSPSSKSRHASSLAGGPWDTELKANEERLMRVACTLAEKGVALRVIRLD
jgi:hypothetical protein